MIKKCVVRKVHDIVFENTNTAGPQMTISFNVILLQCQWDAIGS